MKDLRFQSLPALLRSVAKIGGLAACFSLSSVTPAQSQDLPDGRAPGGVVQKISEDGLSGSGFLLPSQVPCLSPVQRARIRATLAANQRAQAPGARPRTPLPDVRFRWPLRMAAPDPGQFGAHGISNFVDLDPTGPDNLLDYECGTRTYDRPNGYDHAGIDFFLWPFPWNWMDADAVHVVAVAAGTIIARMGGNFDENCGGGGGNWNAVFVEHADGSVAWYGHLKNGSLTPKTVGQQVAIGEYLGVVGSSGNSTGPHLHLEVYDVLGNLIEPFAGPCNNTTNRSWWLDQRPYYDSAVNRLMVGDAPVTYLDCPGRTITNEVSVVNRGSDAFFTAFYRDQLDSQVSMYRLRGPSGVVELSWSHSSPEPHYAGSYWWWGGPFPADAETGIWSFEVDFEGQTYVIEFLVV